MGAGKMDLNIHETESAAPIIGDAQSMLARVQTGELTQQVKLHSSNQEVSVKQGDIPIKVEELGESERSNIIASFKKGDVLSIAESTARLKSRAAVNGIFS